MVPLLLGGCVLPSNFPTERDATVYGLWAKRGQILGDLAHLFCEQGAEREREEMRWAIRRFSYPARVSIDCEDEGEDDAEEKAPRRKMPPQPRRENLPGP